MTKQHTFQQTPPHELHRAYQVIFGQDPRGAGLILERETLARAFRARAHEVRPERPEELGRPREELSDMLKTVALSFDLLADVVGDAEKVWVMPVVDDRQPQAARPWTPKTAPMSSVKIDAGRPSKDVQEATRRIQDALGKLREQTERLAKGRKAETKSAPQAGAAPAPAPAPREDRSQKSLILGRHLHRRGLITLRQLIAAVAWQRAQRPAVGQIAKSWGILDDEQIHTALREKGQGELFCDFAVRMSWMTPFQRLAVVGRQRVLQQPLGRYFIDQGILTEEQVEAEVARLRGEQDGAKRKAG
jgi:hypothetical protein